jgi:peptidoglycan hydrolase-like protein with peptidoglycan-binding domain
VATLQITLNGLFGAGLVVDGSYGSRTMAAVYAFQARYGLTQDGRTGPQTWSQLVWCQYRAEHGLSY